MISKTGIYIERLKSERIRKGMSMAEMAEKLGYKSSTSYMYIEQGITHPTIEKMNLIASILEKPADYFFDIKVQDTCTKQSKEAQ